MPRVLPIEQLYEYDRVRVNQQLTMSVETATPALAGCFWNHNCEPATAAIRVLGAWVRGKYQPTVVHMLYCCPAHARQWLANHDGIETVKCAKLGCEAHATRNELCDTGWIGYMALCDEHADELRRRLAEDAVTP